MITKDTFKPLLRKLGFTEANNLFTKHFETQDCDVKVDFDKEEIVYPENKGFTVNERQTCNFKANENFVVFGCVCRLLEKGYNPEHIELEPKWKLGHGASGGRADIWVRTLNEDSSKQSLLIVECKTAGSEFSKAWADTCDDGAQLFSYFQQEQSTKFLCLYASDFVGDDIKLNYYLINVQDNNELIATLKKPKTYKEAKNNKELFATWKETYQQDAATRGLFEPDIAAYTIGKNKYSVADLVEVDNTAIQKKYHEFATILRQHNVGSHENAFDKLVNLFLCKVVDETDNSQELAFYWKGAAYDDFFRLQDRLQKLYQTGMKKFLNDDVTYIDNADINEAFRLFKNDPDATRKTILDYFRQLKFFTNNDFAFIDVHNEHLFYQNATVLKKIVQMLQDIKLKTETQNQFLGDLFEGFLDQGVKQSEGQFFTPMPIVKFLISSLPLKQIILESGEAPKVIDYACGAGHFLNEYAGQIKPYVTQRNSASLHDYYAAITGIEKEYRLSKVAKVSAFMYGQDEIKIIYADALAKNSEVKNGSYSVLVANPPYSVKGFLETLSETDRQSFSLADEVSDVSKTNSIETFFVERAAQLLQSGGVAAIILPSSILSNGNIYVKCREIILKYFDLVAIAEFGSGTFGKTGTNTATLFMRHKQTNPNIAEHYKNRVNAWFDGDFGKDEVFEDTDLLKDYCKHIKVGFDDYKTLLNGEPNNAISETDLFKEYRKTFEDDTKARSIKKKRITEKYTLDDKTAELNKYIVQSVRNAEKEKIYYFMLAMSNPQNVLIVKSPADNKAMKQFLGYEWSGAKGNEGIKYIGASTATADDDDQINNNKGINQIKTPLFDPLNLTNPEKINSMIRDNFNGENSNVANDYVSYVRLVDMLDFSRVSFDKALRTSAVKKVEIQSKYPLVKLGDYIFENKKSKIQVNAAKELKNATYPFFTSGENIYSYLDYLVDGENIYLSTGGNAGIKFYNGKAAYSTDTYVIKSKAETTLKTKLMFFMLQNIIQDINTLYFKGVGLKHLQKEGLKNIQIPLPHLSIQQQIVSECEKVDEEYNSSRMSIEEYKKGIAQVFENLEVISKNQGKNYRLSSSYIFDISIGRRVLNTEVNPDYDIPVFSANVFEPFGMINKLLFEDFSMPSVLWGIDGDWMVNTIPANQRFYPTDHCGVLRIKTNDILPKYMAWLLEREGKKAGFKRSYRASIDRITSLTVKVAPIKEQEKAIAEVETYEAEIAKAKAVMDGCAARKQEILNKYFV